MRVQWEDWEGWLHRFAGLHIVHLEKKNGKLYNCHRNHYQFRFWMIGTDIRVENCKELLGQQTLTTNSVRTLSLDIWGVRYSIMRNLRRITVIMVMVCLMIGQSGCTGIFDSTKSEVRIAKKVLKEKYNEDFEIITLGGRWGTLTNDTFTVKCYPVSDPDCIFKAEI